MLVIFSDQSAIDYRKPTLLVAYILEQYALHPEKQYQKFKDYMLVFFFLKICILSTNMINIEKVAYLDCEKGKIMGITLNVPV